MCQYNRYKYKIYFFRLSILKLFCDSTFKNIRIINILNIFLHISIRHVCLRTQLNLLLGPLHGLINYKDTKAKCRHLKNLPVKGLCGKRLSEFIDWRYIPSCWFFLPSIVNCCSSNLLSGSTPPPHILCICIHFVGGGGGVLLEFNTMYLTRFRTYKIATPLQTKT
jgi:hypothetical protein